MGEVSGALGALGKPFTWSRIGPREGRSPVILAHGAGAPMTHPFMEGAAAGLVERRLTVARFILPRGLRARSDPERPPPVREAQAGSGDARSGQRTTLRCSHHHEPSEGRPPCRPHPPVRLPREFRLCR